MTLRTPKTLALLSACVATPVLLVAPADAAPTPTVHYTDHNVAVGAKVSAKVPVSSKPDGTHLVLERSYLDRWRTADGTATRSGSNYILRVPTDQFGTFTYRVRALANSDDSPVATSDNGSVTVHPKYDPPGKASQHEFFHDRSNGQINRWDSCQQIKWKFYAPNAPRHALAQLKQAFKRIHQATGLRFKYAGRTTKKPTPWGHVSGAKISLGWRKQSDFRQLNRNIVGIGGSSYTSGYKEADGTQVNRSLKGGVVFNADLKPRVKSGFGKGYTWGEVAIHELGHVMGLDHADAKSQIMYYAVTRRNANWGAGDLAGLRRLGNTRGCLEPAFGRTTPTIRRTSSR